MISLVFDRVVLLKRKKAVWSTLFTVGLLVLTPFKINVFADKPTVPTITEQQRFNVRLHRLQGHTSLVPRKVDDVIKSLSDTVTIRFDCPESTRVSKVTISITTRQIKWDKKLTINERKVQIPADAVGYYIWHPISMIKQGEKIINANNFIMFDPDVTDRQGKNSLFGPFADEALLYHEFLHGQLLIDTMTEKDWRYKVCDCVFDLSPQDVDHEQVPELVYAYLQNLAALNEKVYTIDIPPQSPEDSNGRFEVVIVDAGILDNKENWEAISFYPERSNVEPASFAVQIKDGKIVATGRLIDKRNKGFVIVQFAPRE